MNPIKLVLALALLVAPVVAAAADISSQQMTNGPMVIRLKGEIKEGDDDRFRRLSLQHPAAVVHLASNGGALVPALEIGRIIRIAGYDTVVPPNTNCTSACALIWLAGKERHLIGQVGFHAAYRDNDGQLQESGAANALIGNYMTQLGLPAKAILFATAAPPDKILWLTIGIKDEAGIDFEIPPPPIQIRPQAAPGQVPSAPSVIVPPQKGVLPSVEILSDKEFVIRSSRHVEYEFKYLGLKLRRSIGDPEYPEQELKEFIDQQIIDGGGWIFYSISGSSENKDLILYYINMKSIRRFSSFIELWVKEDHEYNSTVIYRETLVFYKIYCRDRAISTLEISNFDDKGNFLDREYYDDLKERIVPGRMDEALWETMCS
jgi:hypothetical protein